MEDEIVELPTNHNLKCHVCGENQFDEREGFYYCQECGTKQEQVRLVDVDQEEVFGQEKGRTKKQKIHKEKDEKPQLTSWECYNYILRGIVEELMLYGAKEELKLMTLQLWAAYLRRSEVAFFNRKHADLPRLSIRYLQSDAQIIYNHVKKTRQKRRRSVDTSGTSGDGSVSGAHWRKCKRKLDESTYAMESSISSGSGLNSSISASSNGTIKIAFNKEARSFYKRKMSIKHLEKHQADAEGLLTCHKQPKSREIHETKYALMSLNMKQIYSILAIALNLIGDEIQLTDLIGFINEGFIGTSKVLQYFPPNIANNGKEVAKIINFRKFSEKFTDKVLREHVSFLCKHIGISSLKSPDIIELVRRYVKELCLPTEFAVYIERLINFLPPRFNVRTAGLYAGFEARAMAYIIFTLKIFFGLDDNKEYCISRASAALNLKIKLLNSETNEKQPLLFVWNEWMEYIEMRKIIVSQFSTSFCKQFKQCKSTDQVLEHMAEEMRQAEEASSSFNTSNLCAKEKFKIFKSISEHFQENCVQSEKEKKPPIVIEFKPSFTPARSYLKNILLLCASERNTTSSMDFRIPDFMHIDHSERNINSYLKVKPLIAYFRRHQFVLNTHVLATSQNKSYVGIFTGVEPKPMQNKMFKACFDVTDEEWNEIVTESTGRNTEDLKFKTDFTLATFRIQKDTCDDKDVEDGNEEMPQSSSNRNTSNLSKEYKEELNSTHCSIDLFSENNMEPLKNQYLTEPRRNLENIDVFAGISDDESVFNDGDDENILDDSELIALNRNDSLSPKPDEVEPTTPPSFEEFIKIEPTSPKERSKEVNKSPKSNNNNNALKMYISNMDCWMMLGFTTTVSSSQRSELQNNFPRSFNWLLKTCAQTINVDWLALFEQLLCIEIMFCLGIDDIETIKNCVYLKSDHTFREMQSIIKVYREIW